MSTILSPGERPDAWRTVGDHDRRIRALEAVEAATCCSSGGDGTYAELVLAEPSLVAYWPMSDAGVPMQDLSPNNRDLTTETYNTTPPDYEEPGPMPDTAYPYAVDFQGGFFGIGGSQPTFLNAAASSAFSFAASAPYTLEIMAYPTSIPAAIFAPLLGTGTAGEVLLWMSGSLGSDDGKVTMSHAGGAGGAISSAALNLSDWTHVAGTFDGTDCRIYFNGILVGTAATGGSNSGGSVVAKVAGYEYSGSGTKGSWYGSLAHAAIYSSALSAATILEHASMVNGGDSPSGYVLTADGSGGSSWQPPTIEVEF